MNRLEIIQQLDGNTYRLFAYLNEKKDSHNTIHAYNSDYILQIQSDLRIGYQTVYKGLKTLEKEGYIERHGKKNYLKLLKSL